MQEDKLYALISRLKKKESMYFLKIQGDEQATFIQLFKLLQKVNYSNDVLSKKLKTKNIARLKNYLYHSLMDALVDYRKESDVYQEVIRKFTAYRMFCSKGLLPFAEKELEDAIELAEKYKLSELETLLIKNKKITAFTGPYHSRMEETIQELSEAEKLSQGSTQLEKELIDCKIELDLLLKKNYKRKDKAKTEDIQLKLKNLEEKVAQHNSALFRFYLYINYFSFYNYHMVDRPLILEYAEKIYTLLRDNPIRKTVHPIFLKSTTNFYFQSLIANKKHKKHEELFNEYRDGKHPFYNVYDNLEQQLQLIYYDTYTMKNTLTDDFDLIADYLLGEKEQILELYNYEDPDANCIIYYRVALVNLFCFRPDEATFWIERIIQQSKEERSFFLLPYVYLLLCLAQLESGMNTVLPSTIKSTRHQLKKNNFYENFEKEILKFCEDFSKTPTKERSTVITIANRLKKNIEAIIADKDQNYKLSFVNIPLWCNLYLKRINT